MEVGSSLAESIRSSFDALTSHIAIVDGTGRILAVNKAWRDFAEANGAVVDRVCESANYLDVCDNACGEDADQAKAFASGMRSVLDGAGNLFAMEYPCHSPEEKRWFYGRVTPFVSGDCRGVVVAHENITERREKERELLLKNMVFEASLAAGSIADASTRITHVNPAFLRMWGYGDAQETVGHPVARFIADAEKAAAILHALDTRGTWEGDIVAVRKDASTFISHALATTIRDDSGALIGYQSTNLDISRARELEDNLRFQSFLLGQIHDLVFGTDLQGRITYVNESTCRLIQASGESLLGRSLEVFGDADFEGSGANGVVDATLADGLWQGRLVHQSVDGQQRVLDCRTWLLREADGTPVGIVGVAADITERLAIEDHLRQAQKLESIGTLAGGIAHDFNNILTAILGFTDLAIEEAGSRSSLGRLLGEVRSAGLRARELVGQILAFSRLGERMIAPVQIHTIIKEVLKLLRATLPATIQVKQEIQSRGLIMADATQIHQVLMNLCTNAFHAMREKGGVLTVRLSEMEADATTTIAYPGLTSGKYWKLAVSDTGAGMDAAVKARIFDPYFTTKEKGEGTGLGLAVAYGIVKNHHGSIYVESEPGRGTTVLVLLPRLDKGEEPAVSEPTLDDYGGSERILFVDDEAPLVKVASTMLKRLGYQVDAATSGPEALECFRRFSDEIDLVITDLTMPNMTGDQLAEAVRKIRPDVPVVLCTGNRDRIERKRIRECGIDALVMKPWVWAELGKIIREVLEEKHGG